MIVITGMPYASWTSCTADILPSPRSWRSRASTTPAGVAPAPRIVGQERQAEYRGYRAQLDPIARRRNVGAGIDHHNDEHGSERRDRGVGDGSGGKPLQQKHEKRKDHQEMEEFRQWPPPCAENPTQLVIAESRRQQQQGRQQQSAEAQGVPRDAPRDQVKQLDHADQHQRDSHQEGQHAEQLFHQVLATELHRRRLVALQLDSQPSHEQ